MVEETPQINPVDPDPGPGASANGTGSPWQTNGVVSQPSFTPAASAPGEAGTEPGTAEHAVESETDTAAGEASGSDATEAGTADGTIPDGVDDGAIFLASLARAMQDAATADRTRVAADTDQRRDAHIAAINTRRESEQSRMHELADDDRKAIDDWVAAEQQRIQEEKERRTAALEADLKTSLGEHGAKIDREIERVEAAIVVYRADVDAYFERLGGDTDPLVIAQHAARRPAFPDLEKIGRSIDSATDDQPATSDNGTGTTDGAGPSDEGGTDAIAGAAAAGEATSATAEATTEAETPAATDAADASGADAATEEPVAIPAAQAVGVMEDAKPPTKLAQAWAAWNQSTRAADEAAAERAATDPAEPVSFTLTPPGTTPTPAPAGASDQTTAASSAPGPSTGAASVAVAAGTWKPPVPDAPQTQSLAGGAMNWLRRDRDRDHGGR